MQLAPRHLAPRTLLALTAGAALGLAAARPAAAQALDGTSVTGSLVFSGVTGNFFDPAKGGVPAGFGNTAGTTVTVSETQVEFGYQDVANLDTADFRNGQLILTDVTQPGFGTTVPATYTFTDAAFNSVSKLSDTFNGGLTFSLVGHTFTIQTPSVSTGGTRTAVFNINTPAVPEASTTVSFGLLLALGLGGVLVAAKRKKAVSSL